MLSRLRQLRLARGLSLEALAGRMGGVVTKQALSKYERGLDVPSKVVLNKLAQSLGTRSAYLWDPPKYQVKFIAYRKGKVLGKKEQARVESQAAVALEQRLELQELIRGAQDLQDPRRQFKVRSYSDVEKAAETLRAEWELGYDPIASLVDVLEDHSIHVLYIEAPSRFDGMSALGQDEDGNLVGVAVVSRTGLPRARQRLNLAHELGHLLLSYPSRKTVDEEKMAFRFGAAFLVPRRTLMKDVGDRRSFFQAGELLMLKQRFGISIQALLYRLKDLGVITESYYRQWCIHISRLGWKRREPEEQEAERPQWFHLNVMRAVAEDLITKEKAQSMLGQPMGTLPLRLVERRAFMKLPLAERRRMMAEQAEDMAAHYSQDSNWRELQGGDLTDY